MLAFSTYVAISRKVASEYNESPLYYQVTKLGIRIVFLYGGLPNMYTGKPVTRLHSLNPCPFTYRLFLRGHLDLGIWYLTAFWDKLLRPAWNCRFKWAKITGFDV
jgi:hypothetical protein